MMEGTMKRKTAKEILAESFREVAETKPMVFNTAATMWKP